MYASRGAAHISHALPICITCPLPLHNQILNIQQLLSNERFEVLMVVTIKIIFWDVIPCNTPNTYIRTHSRAPRNENIQTFT
jgi:hypothetical protein